MENSILILGATGLLGTPLTKRLETKGFNVFTVSQSQGYTNFCLDVTNKSELDKVVDAIKPDIILNLVAITDVDWCESHIEMAYNVHVLICKHLSYYSHTYGTKIIHISTDHIYDKKDSEESTVAPQNVYALTKLMGELELVGSDATILRTNFFGKSQTPKKKSLTDIMYNSAKLGKPLTLFHDVYFSPLSINTLCELILFVMKQWKPGTYNLGSNNGMSKSDFILKFIKDCKYSVSNVVVTSIESFEFSAKRPKDMRMSCQNFENTFGIVLPNLSDEINSVAREFNE